MCGRFITTGTWAEYRKYLSILPPEIEQQNGPIPNYNVAPTDDQDILTNSRDGLVVRSVRWGLVPHWAKEVSSRPMINARSETVAEKPFFRTAFQHGRCLVPATGYYEWKTEDGVKQPYLIHLPGEAPVFEPLAFAGIMSFNKTLDLATFAIVTLPADPSVASVHNRMPAILKPDVMTAWMDPETDTATAEELLQQNRGSDLVYHPVSKAVGNVRNKGAELIDEVA